HATGTADAGRLSRAREGGTFLCSQSRHPGLPGHHRPYLLRKREGSPAGTPFGRHLSGDEPRHRSHRRTVNRSVYGSIRQLSTIVGLTHLLLVLSPYFFSQTFHDYLNVISRDASLSPV